jgi:hypothetical protein
MDNIEFQNLVNECLQLSRKCDILVIEGLITKTAYDNVDNNFDFDYDLSKPIKQHWFTLYRQIKEDFEKLIQDGELLRDSFTKNHPTAPPSELKLYVANPFEYERTKVEQKKNEKEIERQQLENEYYQTLNDIQSRCHNIISAMNKNPNFI